MSGNSAPRGRRRIGRAPIVLAVLGLAAWAWWVPFALAAWLSPAKPARALASKQPGFESSTYYRTCAAARMAGAAPIERGEPGYRAGLDMDQDGTACE